MADYRTPGVYIEEKNAFPGSAVAVNTAVPVFIGYTETAIRNGKDLTGSPVRISSFAEYHEIFGGGFKHKYKIEIAGKNASNTFTSNNVKYVLSTKNRFYLYDAMRLFYSNGGADCYIFSVGGYFEKDSNTGLNTETVNKVSKDTLSSDKVWYELKKEIEPTLIVIPDAVSCADGDKNTDFYSIYQQVLNHCANMQSCFGIFDVLDGELADNVVENFRTGIGTTFLNYGAAYYPWLKTAVVPASEIDHLNIDETSAGALTLEQLLNNDGQAKNVIAGIRNNIGDTKSQHQGLLASSPTYVSIINEIRSNLNTLPPSAAMAGIYTLIDNSRGVWKAPANVSVSNVSAPTVNVTHEQQADLNVSPTTGKSINVIRPFPGIGTLVWGGRTLDGNSQDWRYINVRRTIIMIEQSLKLAIRAYVFEPNTADTWITISSMINNFLNNLWKQGALAGAAPEQAFDVQVGLGTTMTPTDILDGKMLITVRLAISRPAEFIILTFQQMQQQS